MGNKIIITRYQNSILSAMSDEKRILQMNFDPIEGDHIFGNVYIGKVKNIIKNINAAFIEIENGIVCYLSLDRYESPIYIKHGKKEGIQVADELLVQVSREELKTKAPTVTTGITLTGRYLVLTGQETGAAISKKIVDKAKRKKLKNIAESINTEQYGFIFRTNAAEVEESVLREEANSLSKLYQDILDKAKNRVCFSRIYETVPAFLGTIRDSYEGLVDEFITDDKELYQRIRDYMLNFQPQDIEKLSLYQNDTLSLDARFGIQKAVDCCIREKVWLKSGASIIIQPTEALTVVDVNTEKAIKGKCSIQEMFYRVNLEAAEEIAYQLRLRNITGIIMIDFIDMEDINHRKQLLEALSSFVAPDSVKTTVVDMTALNLVELTRMKMRKPVLEQLRQLNKDT